MTEPVTVDLVSVKQPPPDDHPQTENYFTYGSFVLLVDRLLEVGYLSLSGLSVAKLNQ